MRLAFAIIALPIAACVATPAGMPVGQARDLVGRAAGAAQRCVPIERSVALTVADGNTHMLLYGRGKTIWANDLGANCGFARGDTLVVQPIGANYCHGDLVRSVNPFSGIRGPSCFLGDFVPYTR